MVDLGTVPIGLFAVLLLAALTVRLDETLSARPLGFAPTGWFTDAHSRRLPVPAGGARGRPSALANANPPAMLRLLT